jgi:hypothetical protein
MNPTLLHGSPAWSRAKLKRPPYRGALGSTEPVSTKALALKTRRPARPVAGVSLFPRDASPNYAVPMLLPLPRRGAGAAVFLGGEG